MEDAKAYAAEVQVVNDTKWYGNQLTFATVQEAETYARDLFCRWTATTNWRVVNRFSKEIEKTS